MVLHPCIHCPLASDCDEKRRRLELARPARLTTAKFRCDILRDRFSPGEHVAVTLPVGGLDRLTRYEVFEAVFVRWTSTPGRALLWTGLDEYLRTSSGFIGSKAKYIEKRPGRTQCCSICDKPLTEPPGGEAPMAEPTWLSIDPAEVVPCHRQKGD